MVFERIKLFYKNVYLRTRLVNKMTCTLCALLFYFKNTMYNSFMSSKQIACTVLYCLCLDNKIYKLYNPFFKERYGNVLDLERLGSLG